MDGNKVYINDAKAYISAEPHTLHESGWVYFTIVSKTYSGNVDIAFGFDTETVHPKKAERLNGAGWVNIANKFNSTYWNHDGFNKWYYAKNLPVVAGNTYTVRVWVDIPISTTKISGKYGFAIKSSSQTLQQAKDTGNLYYLDPWFNASWAARKNITVTTNGSSIPAGYPVKLNITYSPGMQVDFDDIRFTAADEITPLSYWIESKGNGSYANVWVNLSDPIADPGVGNIWLYYGNPLATDAGSIADTFNSGNDFSADLTGWTEQLKGTGMTTSISGGELSLVRGGDVIGSANIVSNLTYTNGFILEYRMKKPDGDKEYALFGFGNGNLVDVLGGTSNWWQTAKQSGYFVNYADGVDLVNNEISEMPASGAFSKLTDANVNYGTITNYKTYGLSYSSAGLLAWYVNDVLQTSVTDTSFLSNEKNIYISQGSYNSAGRGGTQILDWVRTRPLIANEPVVSYGDEDLYLISSWSNDYTDNSTLAFDIFQNTDINFSIVPRYDDSISWFVDDVNQSHLYDNLTISVDNVGTTNISAIVTNSTTAQMVSWYVSLTMQLTTPANGSTVYNPYPPAAPEVTFTWTSTGFPYYNLQISTDPYFNYIVSSTYHSVETANIYLLSDEQYYWKVRTYADAYTPGDWSSTSSFNLTSNYSVSGLTGIAGIVYEKKSDGSLIPIQDASVYIRNEALNWSSNQVTGTNGYYLFDNLTNATVYTISAKATGYEDSQTEYVTTVPGQRVTKNILLTKCISGFNCGFLTQPVTFTVRNLFDQEFPGVTVVVYKGDELTAYDTGITDSGGSVTFMLNKDVKYRVTFTGGGISGTLTYYAYGSQTNYRIVVISGFPDGGDRYDYIDANLTTSTINATHSYLTLIYNDSISSTSSISFYATNLTTGTTCWSNSTSQVATLNCSVLSSGTYRFGFTAVSSTYGTIQQDKIINFNAATSAGNPLAGKVDATLLHWGSIMLIVFMAAMFSIKTVKIGAVIVPAMALVLWSLDWLDVNFVLLATAMCIGVMVYMRSSEHKVEAY